MEQNRIDSLRGAGRMGEADQDGGEEVSHDAKWETAQGTGKE